MMTPTTLQILHQGQGFHGSQLKGEYSMLMGSSLRFGRNGLTNAVVRGSRKMKRGHVLALFNQHNPVRTVLKC
jgi:hypothetical protein